MTSTHTTTRTYFTSLCVQRCSNTQHTPWHCKLYIQDVSSCIASQLIYKSTSGWGLVDSCSIQCTFPQTVPHLLVRLDTLAWQRIVTFVSLSSCGRRHGWVLFCRRNIPCSRMVRNPDFARKQALCHYLQCLTNPCLFHDLSGRSPGPFEICIGPSACWGTCAKGGPCRFQQPWLWCTWHARHRQRASRRFACRTGLTWATLSNLPCLYPYDRLRSCGMSNR